jgi:hypothetical protein
MLRSSHSHGALLHAQGHWAAIGLNRTPKWKSKAPLTGLFVMQEANANVLLVNGITTTMHRNQIACRLHTLTETLF